MKLETINPSLIVLLLITLLQGCTFTNGATVTVEYLCADWGPALTLPNKLGERPQFSDTGEEIYFLKQVSGKSVSIYLCKMKPDGSEKTEIKELWHNPNFPIGTQGQSTWMDVNRKTRKIALAITYGGSDVTGLWTMNLDGGEVKRIIQPEQNEKYLQAINHPSWTPDGLWIVFEEELRGTTPNRFNIAHCDPDGKRFARLLEATEKIEYMQPSVSPDGKIIAFAKYPNGYPGGRHLWLADIDGTNQRQLFRENGKPLGGDWPAWSLDGKKIYAIGISSFIADIATGRKLIDRSPKLGAAGWPHWGRLGFIGFNLSGIVYTDSELNDGKWLAKSE